MRLKSALSLLFFFFVSLLTSKSYAQKSFKHLTLTDGLSQSYVLKIVQDQEGFLWIATQDGLNRFDGYDFEVINKDTYPELTDNYIISQAFSKKTNELFIGAINGDLFRLSTVNGKLTQIDYSALKKNVGYVRSILVDENGVWVAVLGDGLYFYSFESKQVERIENSELLIGARALSIDKDGFLWVGCEKGIIKLDRDLKTSLSVVDFKEHRILQNETLVELLATDSELWVSTNSKLFLLKSFDTKKVVEFTTGKGEKITSRVNSLMKDHAGKMWFGTLNAGVFVWNRTTDDVENYQQNLAQSSSISSNYIHDIFEDRNGVIWFGTSGAGLSYINNKPQKIELYRQQENQKWLNSNMIRSFIELSDTQIWVATGGGGISVFNPIKNAFEPNSVRFSSPINSFVWDFELDSSNNLYLGVRNGMQQVHLPTGKVETIQFNNESIIVPTLRIINDSTLLAGSLGKGMFVYNLNTKRSKNFVSDQNDSLALPNNFVFTFEKKSASQAWVGTFGGGLTIFDLNTRTFGLDDSKFKDLKKIDSKVTSIKTIGDELWVGTSNGLYIYNFESKKLESISTKEGLPNNYIYSIERDQQKYIWLSTNKGLTRFDPLKKGRDRFVNFNFSDGIQSLEYNSNASLITKSGDLYFGGVNGFNRIKPNSLQISTASPPLTISKYSVNNNAEELFINKSKILKLGPDDKTISLYLSNLDYNAIQANQFAYKLEGFDSDWVYISNRRFIQFSNLSPDTYKLFVKGTNGDGLWGEPELLTQITVEPSFWQTWWFKLVIALVIGFVLARVFIELNKKRVDLQKEVSITTAKLSRNEELFSIISENIADTIIIINEDMTFEYVSPSSTLLIGYTPDEIYKLDMFSFIHPDDIRHVQKSTMDMFQSKDITAIEFRVKHKDGSKRVISANSSNIINHGNKKSQVIAVLRDITSLRLYEDALIKSKQEAIEANKAKSMFLAGMSHELRTPLNAILGFAQILQQDEEIPKRKREFIQTMYKSGNHLLRMINDVLDFSKIEAGKQEVKQVGFDLMSMAYELESMFALECQTKQLQFDFEFGSSTPRYIHSDPAKLQQVLINLIGNAVKFTEIGAVSFHVKAYDFKDNAHCVLQFIISDTGIGIPDENIETIFDPFHQVDHSGKQGTGLGLSISKKLVELLGGTISLTSELGKGSTFEINLPVNYELIMDLESNDGFEKWHYEGLKVLVVDDISTNREMAREMLLQYNMTVKVAESGRDCINLLKSFSFDVVLMDFLMPDLNGEETLKELRKNKEWDSIPVIALTAYGLNKTGAEFLEMGFDGYLSKPLAKSELLQEIARVAQLTATNEINPQQTLKELSLQTVAAAILALNEDEKEQWFESLEILDLDMIKELLESSSLDEDVQLEIKKETDLLNYRYFLSLTELLN